MMLNMKKIIVLILLFTSFLTFSQQPKATSFVYKKITTAQRDAINVSDATKIPTIYNFTTARFEFYDGSEWLATITDAYTKAETDAKYLLNTTDTFTGTLTVVGDVSSTGLSVDTAGVIQLGDISGAGEGATLEVDNTEGYVRVVGGLNLTDALTFENDIEILSSEAAVDWFDVSDFSLATSTSIYLESNLITLDRYDSGNGNLVATSWDASFNSVTANGVTLTGDQDLSGYLLNTTDTLTGDLTVTGNVIANQNIYTNGNLLQISAGGNGATVIQINDSQGKFTLNGEVEVESLSVSSLNTAPASATATGTLGEIRYTADYIYVCTATNTWKRTSLSTWGVQ